MQTIKLGTENGVDFFPIDSTDTTVAYSFGAYDRSITPVTRREWQLWAELTGHIRLVFFKKLP